MSIHSQNLRLRVLLPLFAAITLLLGTFVVGLGWITRRNFEHELERDLRSARSYAEAELGEDGAFADAMKGGPLVFGRVAAPLGDLVAEMKRDIGVDVFVFFDRSRLDRESWEAGLRAEGRGAEWDRAARFVLAARTMSALPSDVEIRLSREGEGESEGEQVFEANIRGRRFGAASLPLRDAAGSHVGTLTLLRDATAPAAAARGAVIRVAVVAFVLAGSLFALFTFLIGRVDRDIRSAQLRLRLQGTALESAANAIAIADREGRITWYNPAFLRLTGQSMEETLGGHLLIPASEHHPPQFFRNLLRTVRSGQVWRGELINSRKDGGVYVEEATITPVKGPNGEIAHFIAVKQDVTERKRAEHEMRSARDAALEASRIKSEFLANMSHEIRTPLNGIVGMTELLRGTRLDAEQREYMDTVRESAETLLAVIDDVLDFSKVEAGKMEFVEAPFDVRRALGDMLRTLAPRAHEKGLELAFRVAPDVPRRLVGDAARLRQVILNLAVNAVKFTARGEVVVDVGCLGARSDGRIDVEFAVSDTGIGIPPEMSRKIFDAFTQADGSTSRRYGGTGLGLAIASRIVEQMGGAIRVESEPDEGSTFTFHCPFRADPSSAGAPDPERDLVPGSPPVLVVDDNDTTRRILCELLEGYGAAPTGARGTAEAMDRIRVSRAEGRPYRVVIADSAMPGAGGLELIERLRGEGAASEIPILLSPVDRRPGDAGRCRELGVAALLTKPVREHELAAALREALGVAPASRDDAEPDVRARERRFARSLEILLAEDHPVNQRLVARILEKNGHRVTIAATGREAVEMSGRRRFDLVLMDVQMPEMGGEEATRIIREREKGTGGRLPIIALTAHALKKDEESCLAAGMDGYVSKPVRFDLLFDAIDRATAALPAAAVETTATPAGDDGAALDLDSALAMVGGDAEVLREVAGILLEGIPRLIGEMEAAAARGDAPTLERNAHSLRGSIGNLCARRAVELAGEVEKHARAGELSEATALFDALREEIGRLRPAIEKLGTLRS